MAQDTKLEVTFFTKEYINGEVDAPLVLEDIAYVSLLSPETYGPPALISPSRGREEARAEAGEEVLYLHTGPGSIPFSIKRVRA